MSQPLVTILDDEPEIRRILADTLEEAGFRTVGFSRATEFEAALGTENDIVRGSRSVIGIFTFSHFCREVK